MDYTIKPAIDLQPGDLIDLEGDWYADPRGDNVALACELAMVADVRRETDDCVAVGIEGLDVIGMPVGHPVRVAEEAS